MNKIFKAGKDPSYLYRQIYQYVSEAFISRGDVMESQILQILVMIYTQLSTLNMDS